MLYTVEIAHVHPVGRYATHHLAAIAAPTTMPAPKLTAMQQRLGRRQHAQQRDTMLAGVTRQVS